MFVYTTYDMCVLCIYAAALLQLWGMVPDLSGGFHQLSAAYQVGELETCRHWTNSVLIDRDRTFRALVQQLHIQQAAL
jgi:hypothetical protein